MPLQKGNSKEAISTNIAELINAGHEPEQAVAIAYKTAEGDSMVYFTESLTDNIEETPEGFLICRGVSLARTGLMEYTNQGQLEGITTPTVKIGHSLEWLSSPDAIASFEGKSITIEHPPEMLTPENIDIYSVGHLQNVSFDFDSQTLVSDLIIISITAIALVKNGLREVSCGYWSDIVDNGNGTGTLTNIIGNHLALVTSGRCGGTCAIKDGTENTNIKENDMDENKTILEKIKSLFDAKEETKEEPAKEEDTFDAKSAFGDLSKKLDDFMASPSKEDQILALLGKLLESEQSETTDGDDRKDEEMDSVKDSAIQSVQLTVNQKLMDSGLIAPKTPAEINEIAAQFYSNGGK